jgi:hypothetical protein
MRRLGVVIGCLGLGAACGDDGGGREVDGTVEVDGADGDGVDADAEPDGDDDGDVAAEVDAGPLLHVPSPDWREQVIYFVFTDRFADGDPANNDQGAGEYDPTTTAKYSGGDLQGIIDQLDYIQGLGATAVWITPPVANMWWDPLNQFGGFHGYWARDFTQVDEHQGTIETYQALSAALHERGMFLIQDIVANHVGNYFTWQGAYDPEHPEVNFVRNVDAKPTDKPVQPPFDRNDLTDAGDRDAGIYHWTPAIADYTDPVQEKTWQTSDLDDLATENPVVRKALRESYGKWIREVGVDGFRIDTAKFVEQDFWNDFLHSEDAEAPGMHAVAEATGRDDFFAFGEIFQTSEPMDDAGDRIVTSYLGTPRRAGARRGAGLPALRRDLAGRRRRAADPLSRVPAREGRRQGALSGPEPDAELPRQPRRAALPRGGERHRARAGAGRVVHGARDPGRVPGHRAGLHRDARIDVRGRLDVGRRRSLRCVGRAVWPHQGAVGHASRAARVDPRRPRDPRRRRGRGGRAGVPARGRRRGVVCWC